MAEHPEAFDHVGLLVNKPPGTVELLRAMGTLAGLIPDPAQLSAWAQKVDGGQETLGGYIDDLLAGERFAAPPRSPS